MVWSDSDEEQCPVCKGQGTEPAREPGGGVGAGACTHCGGSGYVKKLDSGSAIDDKYGSPQSTSGSGGDPVASLMGATIGDEKVYKLIQNDDGEDIKYPVATIEEGKIYKTIQNDDDEDIKYPVATIEEGKIYKTIQNDDDEDIKYPVATIEEGKIYKTIQNDDGEDIKYPVATIEGDIIYPID
ncbi:hypothetical protein [Haloglomus halophilum]|uniref:hypothetical protein n=1 Tax=Haloglomus halophilum TaxID=2962672 RepID=UPI0020C94559|nr:hypothetical protein [Haloglomus halophilum]